MEYTSEERKAVVEEILNQLGGRGFIIMTGAKDFVILPSGVRFSLPQTITLNHGNRFKVTLNAMDLYDVEYAVQRKARGKFEWVWTIIESANDVYCEDLPETFRRMTGLDNRMVRFARNGG